MEDRKGPFKIWRNPSDPEGPPFYMGEAYAPSGQLCLRTKDLRELGFPPGDYTIRVPEPLVFLYDLPRWERMEVLP
jgi:hypothetical protein